MSEVVIETGIPLPQRAAKWPFGELEVGQSFVMPAKSHAIASAAARVYAARHGGRKFKTSGQGLPAGQSRVWRIA